MKQWALYVLVGLPFLSFNPNDHIVPNTEQNRLQSNQQSTEGYEFPNDPSSNNYFNDPNWPNVNPNSRFNNTPQDAYYYNPPQTYQNNPR